MAALSSPDDVLQNQNVKWAVLIGVNFYMEGRNRHDSPRAGSLRGCVSDIEMVREQLVNHLGLKKTNIFTLTASEPRNKSKDEPQEARANWPTYKNMIRVLNRVKDKAESGDFVYIHYSGHGGQAKTLVPEKKGKDGIDETLIPTDFNYEGRHLRDFEIAVLLKRMVDKGLHVTAVFDSCHSGGTNRAETPGMTVRGIDPDNRPPEKSDLRQEEIDSVLSHDIWWTSELRKSFWLEPQGYTLIAACRPDEMAEERYFEHGRVNGVLTYWLMKTLEGVRSTVTHGEIYRRVSGIIRGSNPRQTPVLMGNSGRPFFDGDISETVRNFIVSEEVISRYIRLEAGRAQGVCKDDLYAVFPWNASGHKDLSSLLVKARVTEVSDMHSKALFESLPKHEIVTSGCQALLSGRHVRTYINRVYSAGVSGAQKKMLDEVGQLVQQRYSNGISPLGLATDEIPDIVYSVTVDESDHYRLLDRYSRPIPNMPPYKEPRLLLDVAAQLGRFQQFRNLKNSAQFPHEFTFELQGVEHQENEEVTQILEGKRYSVQFTNESEVPLFLTVLHFTSLWGIAHVSPRYSDFEMVYPRNGYKIECQSKIPKELSSPRFVDDTLKAFVTTKPSSFRSLTMAGIDMKPTEGNSIRLCYIGESKEQLLRNLVTYSIPGYASKSSVGDNISGTHDSWQTKEVTIRTTALEAA